MLTTHFLSSRLVTALVASLLALTLAGCSRPSAQGATDAELRAFNGSDGKMPDDFKAKLQAAQQNGQAAQQQAAQSARQKAAGRPTGR